MLLERFLIPDFIFDRYDDVTPEFLASIGVRALLIDIDNTLAPYEQPDPDERNFAWVAAMRAAGIGLTFVSNNHRQRVERFAAPLGVRAYWDAAKPFRKTLDIAMAEMGSTVEDTAMLGDQLLTDAYAGKHIGLRTLIVPPIRDKRSLFVRAKRRIERPYIRKYWKIHPKED
jgi:HAD superfamily phosphatase (TIGR01668 family)